MIAETSRPLARDSPSPHWPTLASSNQLDSATKLCLVVGGRQQEAHANESFFQFFSHTEWPLIEVSKVKNNKISIIATSSLARDSPKTSSQAATSKKKIPSSQAYQAKQVHTGSEGISEFIS